MITLFTLLAISLPNLNGDIYDISNRNYTSNKKFSTNFNDVNKNAEYFDVYSPPITSKYAETYWTMMAPVLLPQKIIDRFNNKVMAIIGYETDQVFHEQSDIYGKNDESVPITWAYNHHYEAYLRNEDTQMIKSNRKQNDYGQYNHGAKEIWSVVLNNSYIGWKPRQNKYPNNLFFSEANGGEFRASYHGYPKNYAQLIYSPKYFNIQPMQIDTRNRDPKYINSSIFHAGLLPKNVAAPPNASYSGLLECPCTNRKNISIIHNYNTIISGRCQNNIINITKCQEQTSKLGGYINNNTYIQKIFSTKYPTGCSFIQDANSFVTNITLNTYKYQNTCGNGSKLLMGSSKTQFDKYYVSVNISIDLIQTNNQVTITLEGPNHFWFGVAFDAFKMADLPYSIIVNGSGYVFEDKLGNHGPGTKLPKGIKIISNSVNNNIRQVILTRNITGYYSFNTSKSNIPLLTAIGFNGKFSYHHYRGSTMLSLITINQSTCICDNGITGSIDNIAFHKNCLPEPYGDLVLQHNPSCYIETYQGGLSCCSHKSILLDKEQIQPAHEMTYHLKFRFWFQDYTNQKHLPRFYYQTEAYSGEYDVPKCEPNIPPEECVHSITARFTGRDLINVNLIGNSSGFELIYAAPHCHAPTCISMELYNMDNGELLCHVDGLLGTGNTSKKYDETGYIKLNPCLWGQDEGLLQPIFLSWDTKLQSIKKNNNTYAHYGEMASWQMRGIII